MIFRKSFIRWAGGKTSKMDKFKRFFPPDINNLFYCELFLGSGAFFFYVKPRHAWINDSNRALIASFTSIRDMPSRLLDLLHEHDSLDSEAYYYKIRDDFNHFDKNDYGYSLKRVEQSARFIYMNARCFNGLYRENASGGFNVGYNFYPYGTVKKIYNERNFFEISKFLKGNDVRIRCADYQDSFDEFFYHINEEGKKAFVLLDPPYYPIAKGSNFTSYSSGGWNDKDFDRLKEFIDYLDSKKIKFMLCNSWCDKIKELFSDYRMHVHGIKRYINSDTDKRGSVDEVVVVNYGLPLVPKQRPIF